MKPLILFVFLTCAHLLPAQNNLTGLWRGTITQDEGGYRSEYTFEIMIKQDGDKISGRSYVFVDDIHATMILSGSIHSNVYLSLKDSQILDFKVNEGMEWCMKNYQLVFKNNVNPLRLEGFWQGSTTFSTCVPGKVFLKKVVPRA